MLVTTQQALYHVVGQDQIIKITKVRGRTSTPKGFVGTRLSCGVGSCMELSDKDTVILRSSRVSKIEG